MSFLGLASGAFGITVQFGLHSRCQTPMVHFAHHLIVGGSVQFEEVFVTKSIADWLARTGWRLERVAYPRGGGLELMPKGANPRAGQRGVVPDIIARHEDLGVVIVECKAQPNLEDAVKLGSLTSGLFDDSVGFLLRVQPSSLLLAVGFGVPVANLATKGLVKSLIPLGFGVALSGAVSIEWDDKDLLAECERS